MTTRSASEPERPNGLSSSNAEIEAAPSSRALKRTSDPFGDLVALMARLRDPAGGCPWDREQTFDTIAPYTIEEAYEVADAIERRDMAELKAELGDLVFQALFHARLAEEDGRFTIHDVLEGLIEKMVNRHPHVFGETSVASAGDQTLAWEAMKAAERAAKASEGPSSALDGVAVALPALSRAEKLAKRAARVGFDWPAPEPVFEKLEEEVEELKAALSAPTRDQAHIEEEAGDILFVIANLCRKLDVDPEGALRRANAKFMRRFGAMETLALQHGRIFAELSLDEQESLWSDVKRAERAGDARRAAPEGPV